jgi:large conductance mechanosensitive channel
MSGFKNFILRGNLVEVAVGLIMALSFAAVVTAFVNWLTNLLPTGADQVFSNKDNSFGAFLNALIAFVLMAAFVYFLVVVPYTKAKERFFPGEAAGPSEAELLTEIRDLLASNNKSL